MCEDQDTNFVPEAISAEIVARSACGIPAEQVMHGMRICSPAFEAGLLHLKRTFPIAARDLGVGAAFGWGYANGHADVMAQVRMLVGLPEFRGREAAALDMLAGGLSVGEIQAALRARRGAEAAADGSTVIPFNRNTAKDD